MSGDVVKLKYRGPLDAVEVAALGRVVAVGEVVEVSDSDVAASLQRQGWVPVRKKTVEETAEAVETEQE